MEALTASSGLLSCSPPEGDGPKNIKSLSHLLLQKVEETLPKVEEDPSPLVVTVSLKHETKIPAYKDTKPYFSPEERRERLQALKKNSEGFSLLIFILYDTITAQLTKLPRLNKEFHTRIYYIFGNILNALNAGNTWLRPIGKYPKNEMIVNQKISCRSCKGIIDALEEVDEKLLKNSKDQKTEHRDFINIVKLLHDFSAYEMESLLSPLNVNKNQVFHFAHIHARLSK